MRRMPQQSHLKVLKGQPHQKWLREMLLSAKAPTRMRMVELTKETKLPTNPKMEMKKRAAHLTTGIIPCRIMILNYLLTKGFLTFQVILGLVTHFKYVCKV